MSDENTATSGDVHGTSDSSPRMVDLPNLSHRALALSLDNINNNMGKMASLLTKLCEKPAPEERPQGLKSTSAVSDNSDSEPEETSYKANDGVPRMIILVFTLVMIWRKQMISKYSPSAQRPPAKKSGKSPPRRHSFSRTLQTALTRMTPPATKSSKSWLIFF